MSYFKYGLPTAKFIRHFSLGFVTFILLVLSIVTVKAGNVRVVTRFGKVTGRVLQPGIHLITPISDSTIRYNTKKVIYETTSEEKQESSKADYKDYPVDTNTSDGQRVDIFYTVRFNVDAVKASWIAQNIGDEKGLVERIIKTESRIKLRNIPREFTAEQLYTGDGVIQVQVKAFDRLQPVFEANGLVLDSIGVREILFTEEYMHAVEQKQIEAVNVLTAENIAARAKHEKSAKITEAEGQAEAQRLLRQDLTEVLVSKLWIEKWNGSLPEVVAGDSGILLNIPQ